MLLADAAQATIGRDHERAVVLLRAGARLMRPEAVKRAVSVPSDGDAGTFAERWFAYASRLLISQRYRPEALNFVEEGLRSYPDSAELFYTRGIVIEVPMYWNNSSVRGTWVVTQQLAVPLDVFPLSMRQYGATIDVAVTNQYLRAVALDPTHARARLRLGWIRMLQKDERASADFRTSLEIAGNNDEKYLAHLMLGGVAERLANWPEAIAAYARAGTAGPRYKTACIGLSHGYQLSGNAPAASAIAARCLVLPPTEIEPDPWLSMRFGIPETWLDAWLHQEGQRS